MNFWNSFAEKYQKALRVIAYTQGQGCPRCRFKPASWASFEFHFHSTHGVPRDVLIAAMGL